MIKVYLNRKVSETQITIGNQYESGVNAIAFDLSELKEKWPNGNIYLLVSRKEHTWPYSIDDGEFKIEYVLTWKRGFYQMNVVVTDEKITDQLESSNTIFVSDTINAYVNENQINAKALNEQELPRELQIVYDDLITLKKNIEKDLADGKYIGPQGPKGEPGDVTEEYRNLASQIAQNASDAQTSATNAQVSATNAQKALNDTKEFANQTKTELNQIKTDTSVLKDEANTSAVNAKASETKAKEYADNLQASTDDISQLKEDKITKPAESPTAGKILRVKSVNEDGTFVCEWADCGGSNLDVKVNGKSIVENGIAEIPMMSFEKSGLIQFKKGYGLQNIGNYLLVMVATETEITNRYGGRTPIGANSIDHVVKSAMCDGKGATWKDVERLACLLRMGCTVDENGFVKWTTQEVTE